MNGDAIIIDKLNFDIENQFSKYVAELAKHYVGSHTLEEKILYAVKIQIEWAHRVYMDYNDELNTIQRKLLRKVTEDGTYTPFDRGLLNELLTRYPYVGNATL